MSVCERDSLIQSLSLAIENGMAVTPSCPAQNSRFNLQEIPHSYGNLVQKIKSYIYIYVSIFYFNPVGVFCVFMHITPTIII